MQKILFIGLVWPEPTSSAAGWRILHLVRLFSKRFEVHFASAAGKSEHSFPLDSIGVKEHTIFLNDSSFDQFVEELKPTIVVFDRFMIEEQYGWRVAEQCPEAVRILDTEDLHFVRLARQESFKRNMPVNYRTDIAKREIAAILRSDLSLLISSFEVDLLENEFLVSPQRLFYLPFQEQKVGQDYTKLLPSFEERQNFVFIGNFVHEPNWRTVELLKQKVWPAIRKRLPGTEIHIYGAYPTEKVFQLHKPKEGFLIKGRAVDARDTLRQYRLLLAPIPFGAGAKGKLVDAMVSGTPSICSPIAVESMQDNEEWGGYVEEDLLAFVEKSVDLYSDAISWKIKQEVGITIFNRLCADNSYSEALLFRSEEMANSLEDVRTQNFMGQILMHHSLQSTKYMSLWIEAKNK